LWCRPSACTAGWPAPKPLQQSGAGTAPFPVAVDCSLVPPLPETAPPQNPIIVSAGWDKAVKVWSLTNCKLRNNLVGHQGYVNTVTVSPDGSLCASGGKVRRLV